MVRMIILGAPGSGKGTYSGLLSPMLKAEVIDTGNVLRKIISRDTPLGRRVKEYVDNGMLVPNDVIFRVLMQVLGEDRKEGFILDGYPRTLEQAMALDCVTKIDLVVHLIVPDWLLTERMSNRRVCVKCQEVYNLLFQNVSACTKCGGQLIQRTDDTLPLIRKRLANYRTEETAILKYYRRKGVPIVTFRKSKRGMIPEVDIKQIILGLKPLLLARVPGHS